MQSTPKSFHFWAIRMIHYFWLKAVRILFACITLSHKISGYFVFSCWQVHTQVFIPHYLSSTLTIVLLELLSGDLIFVPIT